MSPSKLTKYCACHAKWPSNIWQKFAENSWNVISNARPIRDRSENDPNMIRDRFRQSATRHATEVTFRAPEERFVLKNTTFRAPAIFPNLTKYCACHAKWHLNFTKYCAYHAKWHLNFTKYCAYHAKWHLNFTKYCAYHAKWHLNFTKYCAYHEKWHLTFTKYCACHTERLAGLILVTYETSFPMRGATNVTLQTHHILRLPRKMTIQHLAEICGKQLKRHFQCAADPNMIRTWSETVSVSPQPATQQRLLFALRRNGLYWKIQHFALRLSFQISPSTAPATKSDTWTSPSTAPTTKSDTWTSPSTAPTTQSDTWTSPSTAPTTQSDTWTSPSTAPTTKSDNWPSPCKYCACHTEWLAGLILVTYETSFPMRGETNVTLQTHQILRLPRKMTIQHLAEICGKQLKRHFQCAADPRPFREWSEHDPRPFPSVRNPPRNRGYFSRSGGTVCIEKYNISRSGYLSKSHQVLRLPRKVTLDLHQVLRLPRKVTLELHQVLRLPRKVTLELHQVLRLPRKVTLELHQVLRLPRKVTLDLHQVLRLPHRMTRRLDPRHIWNVISNARRNKCHPPNSPNTAPATQNDHPTSGRNLRKTAETSFPMRGRSETVPRMIRDRFRQSATRHATEVTFRAPDERFVLKNTTFRAPAIFPNFTKYCAYHEKWHLNFTKYCAYHEKWHLNFTKYCAYHAKWHLNFTKYCAYHAKSHLNFTKYCAYHEKWHLTFTKYCACHTEWLAGLILVTYETSFPMRGETNVTLQTHQILRLPRKMTIQHLAEICGKQLKRHFQRAADPRPFREWSETVSVSPQPATQQRLLFALRTNGLYWKIQHFALRLSFQISPSTAPTTKSDTWPSPSTAAATQNDSQAWSSSHMKRHFQCAEKQMSPSKLTKYCACHAINHPTSGRNLRKTAETSFPMRGRSETVPRMIRDRFRQSATRHATEVTFRAPDERFVLKNTTFRAPAIFPNFTKYCAYHEKWHLNFTKYCAYHEKWHLNFTKYCAYHAKWHLNFTKYCAYHAKSHLNFTKYCAYHAKCHLNFTKYCAYHEKWHLTFTNYCAYHAKWHLKLYQVVRLPRKVTVDLSDLLRSDSLTQRFYSLTLLLRSDCNWLYCYAAIVIDCTITQRF